MFRIRQVWGLAPIQILLHAGLPPPPLFVTICNGYLPVGATLPALLMLIYIERVILCVLLWSHHCKPPLDRHVTSVKGWALPLSVKRQ